jgi:antitoxin (DNA-binding transcriptional repressor) of toxin-antitoxin stability system
MATKITATELSRNLSDILNRVRYKGEAFAIERNGQTIAELRPAEERPRATMHTLAEIMRKYSPGDLSFADDLEEIQRSQGPFEIREWPD